MAKSYLTHLKRVGLLRNLPPAELKRILAISQSRSYRSGEVIFNKSEAANHMFVVVSGRIKIFSRSSSKKRKTFAYLERGAFFGEMGLLDDKARSAAAQAVEDTQLLIIFKKDFKRLILSDAKLCFSLLQAVSERLRKSNDEIESLLFRNILGRVAKTVFDLAKVQNPKGDGRLTLDQKYTHQELADLVGTTREPLSRALTMLRQAGLVDTGRGRITVTDLGKLETLIRNSLRTD